MECEMKRKEEWVGRKQCKCAVTLVRAWVHFWRRKWNASVGSFLVLFIECQ